MFENEVEAKAFQSVNKSFIQSVNKEQVAMEKFHFFKF